MKRYIRLSELRKAKGYTLGDIAYMLGVSKQYVWDLEDGRKRLSYKMAFKIASILRTKPDVVFLEDFKRELPNDD